jgi:hypothetical protein
MATNWPNSVQTFTNPSAGSALNSPSHADQHATVNDTVEALQQYAGLVLVKTQTIGSGVSSVTVTDAFSSTFKNYLVIITAMASSSTQNLLVQCGTRATAYFGSSTRTLFTSTSVTVINRYNDSNFYAGEVSATGNAYYEMRFLQPNELTSTKFDARSFGGGYWVNFGGVNSTEETYTAFTFFPASGTLTGGTLQLYGYNNG